MGGISILSAQVFTTSDHVAVDLFDVEGVFEPEITEARWRAFRTTLRRVIEGAISIDRKVEEMRRHYPAPSVSTPVTVRVDHDASDFSTVLEIGAPDRMGLLYDITDVLSRAQIDVHLAKVATFDGRVVDAFYVRDELGRKLTSPARLAELRGEVAGATRLRLTTSPPSRAALASTPSPGAFEAEHRSAGATPRRCAARTDHVGGRRARPPQEG